ncbi:MAG: chemotaxis protein CheA [Magnetovibrionaceae bacterium]
MSDLDQFKQTYFQECDELLADLEEHLITLQDDNTDIESLHAAFRAVHSVKGGGGAFGFDRLVSFTHQFETLLDQMREGSLEVTSDLVDLSVSAADIMADLVKESQTGTPLPADREQAVAVRLADLTGSEAPDGEGAEEDDDDFDDFDFVPVAVGADEPAAAATEAAEEAGGLKTYKVQFKPHAEMLQRANEPLLLVRELKDLGAVTARADLSAMPSLEDMDPEGAYISWSIDVISDEDEDSIREVFEFVEDDCELAISVEGGDKPAQPEPEPEPEPEPVVAEPKAEIVPPGEASPTVMVGEPAPTPPPAGAKPAAADASKQKPGATSIRVDLEKLDRMVNMVGELVITQAMLAEQGELIPQDQFPELTKGLQELSQHTRELQDNVMAMRAQPVKAVFSKIPRLVRELSSQTGKKINLVMSGEHTEIDKTVIEQLSDPLTHMIRNSCDHGIELPDEREAAGKSREGTIHLSAEHRGGRIVIEIRDDGKGVDRDRVLKKAIEKGLVPPNAVLSDEDIDNLIFQPGFSTAEKVSNISGRGVGMDVVMRNIQSMGGRVLVRSAPGKGSSFSLSLPLTLAVLDGMILRCGRGSYVLPLAIVSESLRPKEQDIHTVAGESESTVLHLRGDYVPLIFLREVFNLQGAAMNPWEGLVIVAEAEGEGKIGIVVDEILGQQQVVIKSLEDNYGQIDGVAGATILGSGKVALILDAMGLKPIVNRMHTDNRMLPEQVPMLPGPQSAAGA